MKVHSVRLAATIVLSATAFGLVACSDEPGRAVDPPPQTGLTTSAAAQPGGQLAAIQACDLLTTQEAATLSDGLEAQDMGAGSGSTSGCTWQSSVDRGVPHEKGITFGINIRPGQSVAEAQPLDGGTVTAGDVAQREAKQIADDSTTLDGACFLTFAAGQGRVDIDVSRNDEATEQSCEIASEVSTLIEPKLPK